MWQLSFRLDNEEEAKAMTERDNEERGEFFKNHVLARCASWHAPVTDLISATVNPKYMLILSHFLIFFLLVLFRISVTYGELPYMIECRVVLKRES